MYVKIVTCGNFPDGGASANFIRNFAYSLNLNKETIIEVILPTGNHYRNKNNLKRRGEIESVKYRYLSFLNHQKKIIGKVVEFIIAPLLLFVYLFRQKLKGKLDVVILYNTFFSKTNLLILLKLLLGFKLLIIYPEYYAKPKKGFLSVLRWYDFRIGFIFLTRFIDGYIALTSFLEQKILRVKKRHCKGIIIPNIIDPEHFTAKNIKPYKENKITIGYAGTPTEKDGIIDLIRSFKLLHEKNRNTHLLIIGDYPSKKTIIPILQKIVDDLGLTNDVSFTGLLPFEKISLILHSCQILALTRSISISSKAGFPTKLGEYFACNKPVLITSVGDLTKYFLHNINVIMAEPGNIEDIADKFEYLIDSKNLQERIAKNAYHWMLINLDYRRISNKIIQLIKEV